MRMAPCFNCANASWWVKKSAWKNLSTNEELTYTVMDMNTGTSGVPEVGVAFAEPNPHFWRVSFAPADGTPRSPEARHYAAESAAPAPSAVK